MAKQITEERINSMIEQLNTDFSLSLSATFIKGLMPYVIPIKEGDRLITHKEVITKVAITNNGKLLMETPDEFWHRRTLWFLRGIEAVYTNLL